MLNYHHSSADALASAKTPQERAYVHLKRALNRGSLATNEQLRERIRELEQERDSWIKRARELEQLLDGQF